LEDRGHSRAQHPSWSAPIPRRPHSGVAVLTGNALRGPPPPANRRFGPIRRSASDRGCLNSWSSEHLHDTPTSGRSCRACAYRHLLRSRSLRLAAIVRPHAAGQASVATGSAIRSRASTETPANFRSQYVPAGKITAAPTLQRSRATRYAAKKALFRWMVSARAHLFALATRGLTSRRVSFDFGRSVGHCLSTSARPRMRRPSTRRSSRAAVSTARIRSSRSARHSGGERSSKAGGRSISRVTRSGKSPSLRKKRRGRRAETGRPLWFANNEDAPGH